MICILDKNTSSEQLEKLLSRFQQEGVLAKLFQFEDQSRLVLSSGIAKHHDIDTWPESKIIIDKYLPDNKRLLTTKQFHQQSRIKVGPLTFGGREFPVIAGPCSVESQQQIHDIAKVAHNLGAKVLRGGAYKPRTSPFDFQGLGAIGLKFLRQAADAFDLLCVSEIMDVADLDDFLDKVDIIQVGARNMQNFSMLKQLGKIQKPILLKRGLSTTYEEFLLAAEYIMSMGNLNVILCERGIRSFEPYTRNTLDIAAIPILKDLGHLPVIVDPSHAVGLRKFVPTLAYTAMAAGADGLMVEMHINPDASISDAKQTISPDAFAEMMQKLKQMALVFDREL